MKTALRPLPRTVAPFPNETLDSYLNRLARANRLDAQALQTYLAQDHRKTAKVPVDRLSAISGTPEHALRYAIVELRTAEELARINISRSYITGYITGRSPSTVSRTMACRRCTLTRGHQDAVWCWHRHEDVVCFRHRRWIGPGSVRSGSSQLDLTDQPEILHAAKQHRRLIRRHGRIGVDHAYAEADFICQQWHTRHSHEDDFSRRMSIFLGEEWHIQRLHPTIYAAKYPQVVALTRLLVSPYWQSVAFEDLPRPRRFIAEVQRTVASDYFWPIHPSYGHFEPLADWFNDQLRQAEAPDLFDYRAAERLQLSGSLDGLDLRTYPLEQELVRAGVPDGPSHRASQLAAIIRSRANTQSPYGSPGHTP
ncbi:TniQ family protein [Streptosporangium amethystogenes]|uniref:TniQ family protein n=1 Tax=Streptosporangium amethystogenes TaxID=2002 RepID=UPI0037A01134